MSRITWDEIGSRFFETGVDHGVLYPQKNNAYPKGVAWSGLTSVTASPSGAEESAYYADNIKYLGIRGAETFGATIECYYYPDEWAECNGLKEVTPGVTFGQQSRNSFAFSYRTLVGNDTDGIDHGYKINLIYGATASVSDKQTSSVNESVEPATFSYTVTTTPIPVTAKDEDGKTLKPVSQLIIDSTKVDKDKLAALEDILYGKDPTTEGGSDGVDPRLPMPDEVLALIAAEG